MAAFSEDFGTAFSSVLGSEAIADMVPTKGAEGVTLTSNLTSEQKELRRLAKRIIKSVQGSLEDAVRQEAELGGRPYEKELRELEMFLDHGILSRQGSIVASLGEGSIDADAVHSIRSHPGATIAPLMNGHHPGAEAEQSENNKPESSTSVIVPNGNAPTQHSPSNPASATSEAPPVAVNGIPASTPSHDPPPNNLTNGVGIVPTTEAPTGQPEPGGVAGVASTTHPAPAPAHSARLPHHKGPPTPPLSSTGDLLAPLSHGGIAWYMEPFDPIGTTIQDERWTGREVLRGMSEELSELDEEELKGLVDDEHMETEMAAAAPTEEVPAAAADATVAAPTPPPKKVGKARSRKKGGRRWR